MILSGKGICDPKKGLDLPKAIEKVIDSFIAERFSFTINYKGMRVVVEEITEDFDPMHPVIVDTATKPRTKFARHIMAKHGFVWWIGIGHACTSDPDVRKIHVIEAFMTLEFMRLCTFPIDRDIIDAAVSTYMKKHYDLNPTEDEMVMMMLKYHYVMFPGFQETLSMFARELIKVRSDAAARAITAAHKEMENDSFYGDKLIATALKRSTDSEGYTIAGLVLLQRKRNGMEK